MDINAWLGSAGDLAALPTATEQQRAALAWRRINDKPLSIAFRTPAGTTLSAQTVRLETDNNASMSTSEAGSAPVRSCIIFGIRNHATLADTDIKEGYRFNYANDAYRVADIILTLGEIQAVSEATG